MRPLPTRRPLALVLLASAASAQDAADAVQVETVTARETYFVHEPIDLALRVGVERGFLEGHLIPLFRRPLDVPVQLEPGWHTELAGARVLRAPAVERDGATLALGQAVVGARRLPDEIRGERAFALFEVPGRILPTRPGELVLPPPTVRFAWTTRFEETLTGRVPGERREAEVEGAVRSLRIEPLPEEGRPPEFTGAVGSFRLLAAVEPREIAAGESLTLTLRIEGAGYLPPTLPAPRLDDGAAFRRNGTIEGSAAGAARVFTYDLSPAGPRITSVPGVSFTHFDPAPPAGYRTARSEPIAIVVRPAPGTERGPAPARRRPPARPPASPFELALLVVLPLGILALVLRAVLRRQRS